MSRKKDMLLMAAGLLAGTLAVGPMANAAAGLLAEPSTQTFYVDGTKVNLEAYAINGHNYVQLRDVGRTVDFNVSYSTADNSVHIDSDAPYAEDATASTPAPAAGAIRVPQSDEPFRPLEGDVVLLDDGTTFTVTKAKPEEPPLPTPACDWSQFPELELPKAETRTWTEGKAAGTVAIRNLYETRRMQYTLYNAASTCPELWENGTLKRSSKGNPIFQLKLAITEEGGVQPFWPWREEQLTQVFYSAPMARYAVSAWDYYKDGQFLYTKYSIQTK